jgi:uncharacterized SAM-binding protein YcdF (DUF218 family)
MDFFWIKKALTVVVLPPNGPLLLAFAGLLMLSRRPRVGRAFVSLGFLTLLVLSTPFVSIALERMVNNPAPLDLARAKSAGAIVILGGGIRRDASEYGGDTLCSLSLERVRYGAFIARKTKLPVLVTGGSLFAPKPEAAIMKQVLEDELGTKVRWTETQSRDTHENALFSAKILHNAGIRAVILVTQSNHIPRAQAEFTSAGLRVVPAPTVMPRFPVDTLLDVVPSTGSLQRSASAIYELLGMTVYRIMR